MATYTHGHGESVLRAHSWRDASNSAAYLLPRLRSGLRLLDVGCGGGTITADLARRVAPGEVLGIDAAPAVLAVAEAGPENLTYEVGDVYNLGAADSWDVVHAHQVLQHLGDPVAALTEMLRVTVPGGVVAVRDADYAGMFWHPASAALSRWQEVYSAVARANGGEPNAGRWLPSWARDAGVAPESVVVSTSTWTFVTAAELGEWSTTWSARISSGPLASKAVELGLVTQAELDGVAAGWRSWGSRPAALFVVPHTELLITRE